MKLTFAGTMTIQMLSFGRYLCIFWSRTFYKYIIQALAHEYDVKYSFQQKHNLAKL